MLEKILCFFLEHVYVKYGPLPGQFEAGLTCHRCGRNVNKVTIHLDNRTK